MQLLSLNYGKNVIRSLLLALTLVVSQSVNATLIEYDLVSLGGSSYQYNYTITNDGTVATLDWFAIFFPVNETLNLTDISTPVGWDPFIQQPDSFLPDDGIADYLNLSAPLLNVGESLGGFSVQFDWIGGASGPGSQFFEVYDPFAIDPFLAPLDSGQTALATVPEPATIFLFLFGLIWLKRKSIY